MSESRPPHRRDKLLFILGAIVAFGGGGLVSVLTSEEPPPPAYGPGRTSYERFIPELDRAANAGEVRIGMTPAQVRRAWGEPYDVNRTRTAAGTSEQWVYGSTGRRFVYFRDGNVTAIQD